MSISADMRPFRERLKEAAAHAGVEYGQTAIAKSLGVSKQTVDQWMGNSRPYAETIYLIADKWKLNPRWLATDKGDPLDRGNAPPTQAVIESPEVSRLILAFGWLTNEQKKKRLAELEADALTNKTFAKSLGVEFEYKSDHDMLQHLLRGGDFPPGAKNKKPKKRKGFAEEDPE